MSRRIAFGLWVAIGLASLGSSCDDDAERAAHEEALRKEPPVRTGNLNQAMGSAERVVPKLPTPQDRFMMAVRDGDRLQAERWLEKGATVESGEAILVAAVRGVGGVELVEWLVAGGAPVDEADDAGRTPLSWAAGRGELAEARLLARRGASVQAVDRLGRTPLHYAVFSGETSIVEFLLEAESDVDARDKLGSTALMYACSKNLAEVVRTLRNAGANPTLVDNLGRTAAQRAHGPDNPCVQDDGPSPAIESTPNAH